MDSEETPLLPGRLKPTEAELQHNAVYLRFSETRKQAIVWMVSGCGVLPLFITGTFTPSIPQIARDFHTTASIVNFAVSLSAFGASVGGLVGGTYSTFYGRRIVYLAALPFFVLGSFGVATAPNIPFLLFWRFLQALGAAPGLVLGAGVIGDIYKVEERGRAMGIFFAACLLGPAIAPVAGGASVAALKTHIILDQFTKGLSAFYFSWRFIHGLLGVVGFLVFVMVYIFFPETSQPGARGIDKLRADDPKRQKRLLFINPLRPLWLLRSPNLFLICMITSTTLATVFVLLVPLTQTIGERYHISNDALIGACFLPAGLGNIAGAKIVGRISDRTVIRWRKKRGGVWYPEDRLRAALVPLMIIIPVPLILFGLVNCYIDGTRGLVISLICLFINGLGIEMAFGPCAAYLVDVMHSRSAESLAANGGLRSVLMAAAIAIVLPMINRFGTALTNIFFALLVWVAYGVLWCIIRYGDRMRAYVDVGYSTAENN